MLYMMIDVCLRNDRQSAFYVFQAINEPRA